MFNQVLEYQQNQCLIILFIRRLGNELQCIFTGKKSSFLAFCKATSLLECNDFP